MTEISITELRANLPAWIDRAARGQAIDVTRRGEVVARLEPARGRREAAREALEGLRATARIGDVESPVGADWDADAPA